MKLTARLVILVAAASALSSTPVFALPECFLSTSGFGFGSNPAGSAAEAAAALVISCTSNNPPETVNYSITASTGGSQSYATRAMSLSDGSGFTLDYNLFTDANATVVWGDGSAGSEAVIGSVEATSNTQSASRMHPIFGRIPAGQGSESGSYSDALILHVDY